MSAKVMGWVWDQEMERDEKFVLLAYADHASHDGDNIYPAVATISKKTGYCERSVQTITRTLEQKGYLVPEGSGPHGTNKWRIPVNWGAEFAPVQKTARGGAENEKGGAENGTLGVQTVAPEPSLTVINRPLNSDDLLSKASPEWAILAGQGVSPDFNAASAAKDAAQSAFEAGFGFGQLPWGSSAAWDRLTAFITPLYAKNPDSFIEYVVWRRGDGKFAAMSNKQIRLNPQVFVDTGWPEYAATLKTTTTPFVPYKHDPRFEKWTPYPGKPKSPIKSEDE